MSRISRIDAIAHPHALSPTPELRQHHDIAAPKVDRKVRRDAHAIISRVEALIDLDRSASDDHIGAAEYDAAMRWHDDFDQASGVRSGDILVLGGIRGGEKSSDGIATSQVAAAARLRAVRDALGPVAAVLLRMAVVEDLSWVKLGAMIRVSDKTARRMTVAALKKLSAHYARVDGVRARDSAPIRAAHAD